MDVLDTRIIKWSGCWYRFLCNNVSQS